MNRIGVPEKPYRRGFHGRMANRWVLPGSGQHRDPEGELIYSYTMLTINADDHSFMRQYHKPEDEKRMVVILDEPNYDAWLEAPPAETRGFLRQFPADNLLAEQAQRSLP